MMKKLRIILPILSTILFTNLYANNIAISNVSLVGQNTTSHYSLVKFNISWDNSWRTSGSPANWDAAWVFIKYRLKMSTIWHHATLNWVNGTGSGDGHTEPAGSDINSANDNGVGGAYGVFIHGNAPFPHGTVNYTGVKLRWNYGVDGLSDADSVELCVFAIEMVYVPQGAFYVGSGGNESNHFYKRPTLTTPYQITSESAITVGTANGLLYYATSGDHGSIPLAFPKGFKAFYCMKYEITQGQYVAFLNKLGATQATARAFINSTSRHNLTGIPGAYATSLPYVADNYLSASDLLAYLDWTALRPMTELEYEKACRGTSIPNVNAAAWGTSIATTSAYTLSAAGAVNEGILANYSTIGLQGNALYSNTRGGIGGPVRVGIFAANAANVSRVTAGSTYCGIMEMSGNLRERTVTVGSTIGRIFTGSHGNGVISPTGFADVTTWPTFQGLNLRGGAWTTSFTELRVSDRTYGLWANDGRYNWSGGHGVRTAP